MTFVESGQFLWNSGIFVWTYKALLRAMRSADAGLASATEGMLAAAKNDDTEGLVAAFHAAPRTSVDYAVMEKADKVVVVRADFQWTDLGSFAALGELIAKDAHGNVALNHVGAKTLLLQSEDCTVYSEGEHTVALFGVRDLIVVNTGDAVLVCPRNRAEDIKEVIQALRHGNREDLL